MCSSMHIVLFIIRLLKLLSVLQKLNDINKIYNVLSEDLLTVHANFSDWQTFRHARIWFCLKINFCIKILENYIKHYWEHIFYSTFRFCSIRHWNFLVSQTYSPSSFDSVENIPARSRDRLLENTVLQVKRTFWK